MHYGVLQNIMKLNVTRVLAGVLALVGCYWALLLILSILGIVGFYLNLAHIPGWLCFVGWWRIALGKELAMPESRFWAWSVVAHLWLLFHTYILIRGSTNNPSLLYQGIYGICGALLISVIAYFLSKRSNIIAGRTIRAIQPPTKRCS